VIKKKNYIQIYIGKHDIFSNDINYDGEKAILFVTFRLAQAFWILASVNQQFHKFRQVSLKVN